MSKLLIEVPDSLREKIARLAAQAGISPEQFIEQAVASQVEAAEQWAYLEERAKRGSRADFEAVLAKVADFPSDEEDKF